MTRRSCGSASIRRGPCRRRRASARSRWRSPAYDPPREFAFRMTYDGGDSTSVYTLDENGGRTKLECRNDTDMAAPAPIPEEIKKQIENAPFIGKMIGKMNLGKLQEAMAKMADNPLVEAAMDKELDASLEKLKKLVEDGR